MKYIKYFFLLLAVYLIWGVLDRKKYLVEEKVVYAVGKIYGIRTGGKQAPSFEYNFFDGKKMRSGDIFNDGIESASFLRKHYIGKKYLIRFSKEKPIYSEILLSKKVPEAYNDSIKYVWDKPPF